MPHLNWRNKPVGLSRAAHVAYQSQLELRLSEELARELAAELEPALMAGGPELRLDLPDNWTVYWKAKTGLSRLQLAHPQAEHWVATVHLTAEHGTKLIEALRGLSQPSECVSVTALGPIAPLVNFELVFVRG